jgi:hypothetical protein
MLLKVNALSFLKSWRSQQLTLSAFWKVNAFSHKRFNILKTKLYKWWKPPPVPKVVKSGLHFNILSSDEVNQVIVWEREKQGECDYPQKILYKPSSDRVSVTGD